MRIRSFVNPAFGATLISLILTQAHCQPLLQEPWVLSPPAVSQQEISFASGDARLTGTLFFPRDEIRRPAMIVLQGASSPSRNLPLYRHLVEMLPPLGMAVFVFDRRGSGGSTAGNRSPYDFDALADDAVAACKALVGNVHIDPARIGFWGISQGGWLALLAAAKDPQAAFAISVSAPMTTPDVQMNFAVANILRIHGYSAQDAADAVGARSKVDDYLRGKMDRAAARQAIDAIAGKPWFHLIYMSKTLEDPGTSSWAAQMRFDPTAALNRVGAPVLMLYGQADPWVPVQLSLKRLAALKPEHHNIETVLIDRADHTMMTGVDPKSQVDAAFFPEEAPNAPEYFAILAAWLTRHGFFSSPVQ